MKRYLPHVAGLIVGSLAGWYAAAEFAARVPISDTIRIAASGVLLLLFISGLSVDAQGHIIAAEFAPSAQEEPAS